MRAILTYHSVDETGSVISIEERTFRRHVAWLAKGNVRVVPLQEIAGVPPDEDAVAIIEFASDDCDRDYRQASDRGAETMESPQDCAWGVRAAYLRGPGRITFEIEEDLPSLGEEPPGGT